MFQAIQAFTPPPPSYPYQGNPQQQVSAALASSSSGMQGDTIALAVAGGTVSLLALGAVILTAAHFAKSTDKPKPTQATSSASKPIERAEATQIESTPTSTEKTSLPQPVSPPQSAPPPQPTRKSQYITLPGLPGFIDPSDGVYRERQIRGLCGLHALNTVLYKLLGKEGIITIKELIEKFGEEIIEKGLNVAKLMQLAQDKGLETKPYDAEEFVGKSITGIEDSNAFIIGMPTSDPSDPFHAVAIVRSKKGFCLSNSGDQDKREIYFGDADKALHDYQIRHKVTAREVVIFRKRVPAQGMVPQRPLHRSGAWRP